MTNRKLESGLLKIKCDNCNNIFEQFSRDIHSMSSHDCPQCASIETDVIEVQVDLVWTQDSKISELNRKKVEDGCGENK